MKKLAIALSFACAGALAFADSAQWNTNAWITGISPEATSVEDVTSKAVGGAWTFALGDEVTFANNALTIDAADEIQFKVNADSAATAKTAQKITVKGVFTPCAATELLAGSDLNTSKSQLGFAVVSGTGNDDATTYTYYAWVGGTGGAAALNDWVELATCQNSGKETELTVEFNYWAGTATATFAIKNGGQEVSLKEGVSATQTLTSTAVTNYKVGEIACTGSGSLSALDGVTGISVASVGDTVYATAASAITAAQSGDNKTVKLLTEISGDAVTVPSGVTLAEDGENKSSIVNNGTVQIDLTTAQVAAGSTNFTRSISNSGAVKVVTTDKSKECVAKVNTGASTVDIVVQTSEDVLGQVKFEDTALTNKIDALRTFLDKNCKSAYVAAYPGDDGAANAVTAIKTALEANGENGLTKWQSYALGIDTATVLAIKYAAATANGEVAYAPTDGSSSITSSGDFDITYVCNSVESKSPDAIKIPDDTGVYPVKMVFTKKAAAQE